MKKNAMLLLLLDAVLIMSLYSCKKETPTYRGGNEECIECYQDDTLVNKDGTGKRPPFKIVE